MAIAPAVELTEPVDGGRRFTARRTVRLGDVDPGGHLRLDGISRYLQDVATDDALDAELTNAMGWVVRRTMIRVDAPATMNEPIELTTFCSGHGRSWAERRTSIVGDAGAAIEAVSLWVQLDVETGRPSGLDDDFFRVYGVASAGRRVSTKLSLPAPPVQDVDVTVTDWAFRRTDLDPFGHVNNAVQWCVFEDAIQTLGLSRIGVGEIEYRAPIDLVGEITRIRSGDDCWLTVGGRVSTAMRWTPQNPCELSA